MEVHYCDEDSGMNVDSGHRRRGIDRDRDHPRGGWVRCEPKCIYCLDIVYRERKY